MKSTNNDNRLTNQKPLSKRRLKTKPIVTILMLLLIGNIFWFSLWLLASGKKSGGGEPVATIDGVDISRQQWMVAMENRYGKETLQTLVNEVVMEKAAKKYHVDVTEEEIDLELALVRSAKESTDMSIQQLDEDIIRQSIRAQLILYKVLTKDIIIEEQDVKAYYDENQSLYNIPTSYKTSIIVVQTKEDAEKTLEELESGSDFAVLARERSLDSSSASLGGDIGFVTDSQENIDSAIPKAVAQLNENEVSEPFALDDGRYAIVFVKDISKGKSFTYEDVSKQIRRVLALEQLPTSITIEAFWKEFNATWFYGAQ